MENTDLFGLVAALLFVLSELLAFIPKVKANSVFQLIYNIIHAVYKGKLNPTATAPAKDPVDNVVNKGLKDK